MDIKNKFAEYEIKNNLFELSLCEDIFIWPFIRLEIYDHIEKKYRKGFQKHTSTNDLNFLTLNFNRLKELPNAILKNPFVGLEQRKFLFINHPRRKKNNGIYKSLYIDDFIKELDSYYVFENPYLGRHLKPNKTNNLKYMDTYIYLKKILKEFYKIKKKKILNQFEESLIEELFKKIEDEFDIKLNLNYKNYISNLILNIKIDRYLIQKILLKIKPDIIFEVVYYGYFKLVLNDMAKKLNIKTIELQHGVMGNYLPYYFKSKDINKNFFPEYIYVFGDYWKEVNETPLDNSKLIPTGYPHFENQVNKYKNNKTQKKEVVLFISQGEIGSKLSKIAVGLNEYSNKNNLNFEVIYKLHPGEYDRWKREYKELLNSEISVIDSNDKDLYYFLNRADHIVGVSSTVLFESLAFDSKKYIIKFNGYERIKDLCEYSNAVLVDTQDELINKIVKNYEGKNKNSKDFFWKNNAVGNMIDQTKLLLG